MTLTKNKMVSEVGRRTRLKNRDVQAMIETLVEVWTEELVSGGRIELERFMVLEVDIVTRPHASRLRGGLATQDSQYKRVRMRTSKYLRGCLNPRLLFDG